MDMSTFWSSVPQQNLLSHLQVKAQHPDAWKAAKEDFLDNDDVQADFAFSVIPNCGPGGPTADGDEDLEDADGPSACGDEALMAYVEDNDELYHWKDGQWLLWNY